MINFWRSPVAAVAALAVLTGVAAPASASSDPPTQPPRRVSPTPPRETDCATTVARLAAMAAAGVPNAQCAEQRDQPTAEARASLAAQAPAGVPRWCVDHAFDGWWTTRTTACSVQDWFLKVYDTGTQQMTGTMSFLVVTSGEMSTTVSDFGHRMTLRSYGQSGAGVGTGVWALNDCEEWCALDDDSFPIQTMTDGTDVGGWATFISLSKKPGQVGGFETSVTFILTNPGWFTPGIFSTVTLPRGRCDNATPGVTWAGCVFPDYEPAWLINGRTRPAYARFVRAAQASGLPAELTRLTDPALVAANDAKACSGCAVYPPSSTHQGAATGGGPARTFRGCLVKGVPAGVTGSSGYGVCRVPAAPALDSFYADNRIIEADPYIVKVF